MIPADQVQDVARAINAVVGHYAPKVRRSCDERDLVQRAWVVALETLPRWRAEKGPLVPYLATVIRRQLGRELVRVMSPVSASKGDIYALYGTCATGLDRVGEAPVRGGDPFARTPTPEATVATLPSFESALADHEWDERVLSLIALRSGEEGFEGVVDLLRDEDEAPPTGRPAHDLQRSRAVACVRIAQDAELRGLLRERG